MGFQPVFHRIHRLQTCATTTFVGLLALASVAFAQDTPFEKQSGAYRTALHYDPSLGAPLTKLVELYRAADRVAELKAVYEAHIAQYPADPSGKAVLIRVYRELRDPQAAVLVRQAAQQHADSPYIQFLLFQQLLADSEAGALEALSRAIELETRPERRLEWLDRLLEEADAADDRALAEKHLVALRDAAKDDLAALQQLAEKMERHGFQLLGLATIALAEQLNPAPETNVDLQLLAAKMEAGLDRAEDAGKRLDALLAKVAPDYFRRGEIMTLRVQLLNSNAAREAMLAAAREAYTAKPTAEAALDLVELLEATGLRREAAKILTEASQNLPHVEILEQRALEVLERVADDEATIDFLEARLKEFPERGDLRYRLAQNLFLAGDRDAANAEMDLVLSKLGAEEQIAQRLDLCRFLRGMNLAADAIPVFEVIVEDAPARLDIRRELAEAYLATGKRESARELIAKADVAGSEIENFLDFVQFMATQDFLTEARKALETRVATDDKNLDLKLRLVDVFGRIGDQQAGQQLLRDARPLADTAARYRQWIEAGMKFSAEFDHSDLFFDSEQHELLGSAETWDQEQIERFLTLCEVGEDNRQRDRVAHLLRSQLDSGKLPPELQIQVRRLLVRSLADDPVYSLEVESQLKFLITEDPGQAPAYNLSLGLLYNFNQRPDLARPLLAEAELDQIQDARVLKEAYPVLISFNLASRAISALRRLTAIEPANRTHWEKLLNLLAATGAESEFRQIARQLLGGGDRLDLNDETVATLRTHIADSYWRSIARSLDEPDFAGATALLDSLDRNLGFDQDRLWSLWARAFVLNQLGQLEARDGIVQQLLALASRSKDKLIQFPDGLAISPAAAERVLKEPAQPSPVDQPEPDQLSGALAMKWGFEADPGATIVQIQPAGDATVLVLDHRRTIYAVDARTGKLLWRKTGGGPDPAPRRLPGIQIGGSGASIQVSGNNLTIQSSGNIVITGGVINAQTMSQALQSTPKPIHVHRPPRLVVSADRLVIAEGAELRCLAVDSGLPLWTNAVSATDFEIAGSRVLSFDSKTGLATSVDVQTGKLTWSRSFKTGPKQTALNSGASFDAERMIVYGETSAILDSRTGETLWEFAGGETSRFPLFLFSNVEQSAVSEMNAAMVFPEPEFVDHLSATAGRAQSVESFLQRGSALVAPAARWADQLDGQARFASLEGRKLLLMSDDGVAAFSLDLPVSARTFDLKGSVIGGGAGKVCFFDGESITILDLASGQRRVIDTKGQGRVEAFAQGHRVYASSADGIRAWNLNTGQRVFAEPWPPALAGYAAKQTAFRAPEAAEHFWQGLSTGGVCYPTRSTANGENIYVLVGDSSIAALGPREAVASRQTRP